MNTPALRWRRLAAGLLDFTPFILAVGMVLPMLVTMGLVAYERLLGIGIFDPALGADPVPANHSIGQHKPAVGTAVVMAAWFALEAAAAARRRGSIGKHLFGLTPERGDGKPLTRSRALLREMPRHALAFAVTVAVAFAAALGVEMSVVVVLLMSLLAIHLAADVVLLLVGRPSLADRLARTRVSSADAAPST